MQELIIGKSENKSNKKRLIIRLAVKELADMLESEEFWEDFNNDCVDREMNPVDYWTTSVVGSSKLPQKWFSIVVNVSEMKTDNYEEEPCAQVPEVAHLGNNELTTKKLINKSITKSGYLVNFEVYQGCTPNSNPNHQKKKKNWKGDGSPLAVYSIVSTRTSGYTFPFTSINLVYHLKEEGYGATGTIREYRLPKNGPLRSVKQMKKTNRRTFYYTSTTDKKVVATIWMDNSVVTVVSMVHVVHPLSNANRYSSAEKRKIGIPRPNTIGKIGIRGKKWGWPIFTWLVDSCLENAWIIYRKHNLNVTQLIFRREIAQVYLKQFQNLPKSAGRPSTYSTDSRIAPAIRYDRVDHIIEHVPNIIISYYRIHQQVIYELSVGSGINYIDKIERKKVDTN
ncbi:hypothetical protein NQ318_010996 [Aromia moschata]|uniref:PiggyBac transposable element-derived protein domain-containing protein n=1 Tax=Aromia moschata TaxID=1265417 RepID=A0AAV8YJV1_9CUCU|nr:hypothetical protein NQ318_010996 [Aromia moschata]